MVFAAEWMAERLDCQVVMLVRHPAGIVSSLARIGTGWSDNLPDIAAQPELIDRYLKAFADRICQAARQPFDPIAHGALLWNLIHTGIAHQLARNPNFIVVRYEDLAADPITGFRDLYQRIGLPFGRHTEATIRQGCLAGPGHCADPWGRVGLSRTAYQPMHSPSNAWAWRDRLAARDLADVLHQTETVAQHFYTTYELHACYHARERRRNRD